MNDDLIVAATRLADTLAEENAALAALDLPRAASILADKQRAAAGFIAAQSMPLSAARHDAIERVAALATENRALLERAMTVQSRVIGVIARAAAPAIEPSVYGAQGERRHAARAIAFTLSSQA
jgi:ferric-dicitrate binding protein FerR (iron transport regulator)